MNEQHVRYTDTELLDAVRAVALLALPDAPDRLSQPQFDKRRAEVADTYPGLPTARAIYMWLNSGTSGSVSWASLVRGAVAGGVVLRRTVVVARRAAPAVPLTDRGVFFALNLVARTLGSDSPSPDQYDLTAERLRRTRRGALAKLLPTSSQLIHFAEDWNEALRLAQLQPRVGRSETGPARAPRNRKPATVSVPYAIELFLQSQGYLPTDKDLRWFASEARFALADNKYRPWRDHVEEARTAWSGRGRWFPPRVAPFTVRRRCKPNPDDLPPDLPSRIRNRCADIEARATALNEYWDTLPPEREPKQSSYRTWAVGRDAPPPSCFGRHGGFSVVREHARHIRRRDAKAEPLS